MASPAEIFNKTNVDIFMNLGDIAAFMPVAGQARKVHALVSSSMQLQPNGLNSESWAQLTTVELLLSEFAGGLPEAGDVVEVNGAAFRLAAPTDDDGLIVKYTVVRT